MKFQRETEDSLLDTIQDTKDSIFNALRMWELCNLTFDPSEERKMPSIGFMVLLEKGQS